MYWRIVGIIIVVITIIITIRLCAVHGEEGEGPAGSETVVVVVAVAVVVLDVPNGRLGRIIGDARHLQTVTAGPAQTGPRVTAKQSHTHTLTAHNRNR